MLKGWPYGPIPDVDGWEVNAPWQPLFHLLLVLQTLALRFFGFERLTFADDGLADAPTAGTALMPPWTANEEDAFCNTGATLSGPPASNI